MTGHTGFKGTWLCEWLLSLGAEVVGLALDPPTEPSLFNQIGLGGRLQDIRGDIRDSEGVKKTVLEIAPDFIFHLAAQPLVRESYQKPVETYETNVMGTVHVLEALRAYEGSCVAIMITTDKCYENREWMHGYREEDPLGGYDPYSSSKAAAEIVVAAYRRSFFKEGKKAVASARAGNVIGPGDWAKDRIVPDCVRALQQKEVVQVRNPHATRPWQHVLEPLGGYLSLAAHLSDSLSKGDHAKLSGLASAFNFGPNAESNRPVRCLVEEILHHWPGQWKDTSDPRSVHEASLLHLTIDKARHLLGWHPAWNFQETIQKTAEGYQVLYRETAQEACRQMVLGQIREYQQKSNLVFREDG